MKTFLRFLAEDTTTEFSPADFPMIRANWKEIASEGAGGMATHSVARLEKGGLATLCDTLNKYRTGGVPNPVFVEIKDAVNRFIDVAGEHAQSWYEARRRYSDRVAPKFDHLPEHDRFNAMMAAARDTKPGTFWSEMGLTYSNQVVGKRKKTEADLKKFGTDPDAKVLIAQQLAVLKELEPMALALEDMKTRIVKRQPKAPEDGKVKYLAPMMSNKSGKIIVDALTEITNTIYDDFAAGVTAWLVKDAQALAAMDPAAQRKARMVIATFGIWERSLNGPMRLKDDYVAVLTAEGKTSAKQMQDTFIVKNAKKLGSILDKKSSALTGNPEILRARASQGGHFEGVMKISFVDGSQFTVTNKVVFKRNNYGTNFVQFPTTFHDVVMPDGKKMGTPNEEKMNTVFAVA